MNTFKNNILLFISFLLFGCIFSLIIGAEKMPYDTLAYHLYNAHAFICNKVGIDLFPAGIYSYLNPYIELPFYFVVKYLNEYPKIAAFLGGSTYGIYMFTLYKLFDLIFLNKNLKMKRLFIIISLLCAGTGTIAITNLGTTYNDIVCVNFVFIALFILFRSLKTEKFRRILLILCGLCLGLSCAVKIQYAIYPLAMFLTLVICKNNLKITLKEILFIFASSVFSFFCYNADWYYKIYILWGNPLFPFANNVFKSPYAIIALLDKEPCQFPQTIMQWVFYPFYLLQNQMDGQREARLPILMMTFFLFAACFLSIKSSLKRYFKLADKYFNVVCLKFLMIFISISYIIWMFINPYSRYILPLESLTMVFVIFFIFLALSVFGKTKYTVLSSIIVLSFIILTTQNNITLGTRTSYQDKIIYFQDMQIEDNSVVILDFYQWTPSAVVAFQNPKAKYITYPFLNPGRNDYKQKLPAFKPMLSEEINNSQNKIIYIISSRDEINDDFKIFTQNHNEDFKSKRIETNMPVNVYLYKYKPEK